MGFLSGLFKKKPGGTFFGNLLRGVAKAVPIIGGTVIGTDKNKIELGQTKTNAELAKEATTFAGQPATISPDGTINMTNPLPTVTVTAQGNNLPDWVNKVGDIASELGKRATEQTQVKAGVDQTTLFILGGVAVLVALIVSKK